jgi:Flp pilus assembly protein TadG
MRTLHGRLGRDERGQALVEFALILPIILLLVVGMLEFARAWNLHQVMTDAAREGARRAVLADTKAANGQTQDSVKAAMWNRLAQFGYDPSKATMTITTPGEAVAKWKETGWNITVNLVCPYRFWVVPWMSITMRTSFTMRNE